MAKQKTEQKNPEQKDKKVEMKNEPERIREVDVNLTTTAFTTFFRKFTESGREYGNISFKEIAELRQLLSDEKARMLYTIKTRSPTSIYELAKMLKRDFKSVRQDIELLKRFGFVRFEQVKKGERKSLKPLINMDKLKITINLS
jgi:predicted transcriptional regulator